MPQSHIMPIMPTMKVRAAQSQIRMSRVLQAQLVGHGVQADGHHRAHGQGGGDPRPVAEGAEGGERPWGGGRGHGGDVLVTGCINCNTPRLCEDDRGRGADYSLVRS